MSDTTNLIQGADIFEAFNGHRFDVALRIAADEYKKQIAEEMLTVNAVNKMQFKYGQVVRLGKAPIMARILNADASFGIIVGHMSLEERLFKDDADGSYRERIKERDTYRVHQSSRNPFIGTDAAMIHKLDSWDGVPDELKEYKIRINVSGRRYVSYTIKTFI